MIPRYIDANQIQWHSNWLISDDNRVFAYQDEVDNIPAANVEEVKHGEWVRDADLVDGDVWVRWSCSECGYVRTRGWEYTNAGAKPQAKLCENCGTKMDGKEKNNGNNDGLSNVC